MRSIAPLLAALFALSLPVLAQAGDGCPYSKPTAVTASVDAPDGHAGHHGDCSGECSGDAKATEGGCPCASETTAAAPEAGEAETDASQAFATND